MFFSQLVCVLRAAAGAAAATVDHVGARATRTSGIAASRGVAIIDFAFLSTRRIGLLVAVIVDWQLVGVVVGVVAV